MTIVTRSGAEAGGGAATRESEHSVTSAAHRSQKSDDTPVCTTSDCSASNAAATWAWSRGTGFCCPVNAATASDASTTAPAPARARALGASDIERATDVPAQRKRRNLTVGHADSDLRLNR